MLAGTVQTYTPNDILNLELKYKKDQGVMDLIKTLEALLEEGVTCLEELQDQHEEYIAAFERQTVVLEENCETLEEENLECTLKITELNNYLADMGIDPDEPFDEDNVPEEM